jgi:hypothetical protein
MKPPPDSTFEPRNDSGMLPLPANWAAFQQQHGHAGKRESELQGGGRYLAGRLKHRDAISLPSNWPAST